MCRSVCVSFTQTVFISSERLGFLHIKPLPFQMSLFLGCYCWIRSSDTFVFSSFLPHISTTYFPHSSCLILLPRWLCSLLQVLLSDRPGGCDGRDHDKKSTPQQPQETVPKDDLYSPALWNYSARQKPSSTIWILLPLSCSLLPGNTLWSPWSLTPVPSFQCAVGNLCLFLFTLLFVLYIFLNFPLFSNKEGQGTTLKPQALIVSYRGALKAKETLSTLSQGIYSLKEFT